MRLRWRSKRRFERGTSRRTVVDHWALSGQQRSLDSQAGIGDNRSIRNFSGEE